MDVPEVHYARSGGVAIAYQVLGDGPMDVLFVRGTLADLLAASDQRFSSTTWRDSRRLRA
jgi:hypothetical protein